MKKILFPTDFSTTAAHAFQYALSLAESLGARIDLLSVYHLPLNDAGRVPPEYIEQMLAEKKQQVIHHIKEFVTGAPSALLGQFRADYGLFVAQEIVDAARTEEYDLIVMGTKGEHNPLEKMLGTVTTQTMMSAPCPVLAIPQGAEYRPITDIAYATDFSPADEHAVEQLRQLADLLGASIHFLHVDTDPAIGQIKDQIKLEHYPFPFTEFIVINNPSVTEGIDEYIRQKDIDLLALFIPRRRLWERLFHSSFTKRMTFHSKVPLLVFRG